MGICTLIAIVSCRMSVGFFEPTIEWSCGNVVLNGLLVLDQEEDFLDWEWAVDLVCEEDWDGEDFFFSSLDAPVCNFRPRPALVVDWTTSGVGALALVYGAIREGFRAFARMIAEPVCAYAPTPICGEKPVKAKRVSLPRAAKKAAQKRAEKAAKKAANEFIMINGAMIPRDQLETNLEWIGTDGKYAKEWESNCDWLVGEGIIVVGEGVSSCERQRIDAGWENPTKRHTGMDRARVQRDRQRQSARRIKAGLLGC